MTNNTIARPASAASAWKTQKPNKGVTVAVIGSQEDIAFSTDIIQRSSTGSSNLQPSLMKLTTFSAPKSTKSKASKATAIAKFAGKTALAVGIGMIGTAAGFAVGALAASVGGALGIAGGVLAGAGLLATGASSTKRLPLAALGIATLGGALALTGSPIAGGVVALGVLGSTFIGLNVGGNVARVAVNGSEAIPELRRALRD
jgi:hypothetical protein